MEEERDGILSCIRALILANKRPLPLHVLADEYEVTEQTPIPFRKHNFASLEEFLKSLPTLRVSGTGRNAMVEAQVSSASKHVTDLIAKQKTNTKKIAPPPRRGFHSINSYRGGRGRGRGRGGYSRFHASRDYPTSSYNSSRDHPTSSSDWGTRQPTASYSARQTWDQPSRSYSVRETENHSNSNHTQRDTPSRYSPDQTTLAATPLTIKVDSDDRRQVTLGQRNLPPRFQRQFEMANTSASLTANSSVAHSPVAATSAAISSISPRSQGFDSNVPNQSNAASNSLRGRSHLSARTRGQDLQARLEQQRNRVPLDLPKLPSGNGMDLQARLEQQRNRVPLDLPKLPSSNAMNDLTDSFSQLGQQGLLSGAAATGDQFPNLISDKTYLNGQNQISEELLLPQPDENVLQNNPTILEKYCLFRGWPKPTYKMIPRQCPDKRKIVYLVNVEVNGDGVNTFKVNSFPVEHEDPQESIGAAALKALLKIQVEESKVKDDIKICIDHKIICSRISDIVAGKPSGLFANAVEEAYITKHNEKLPLDWIQTVSRWPTVSVESTVNNTIIVPQDLFKEVEQAPQDFDPTIAPPALPIESLANDDGTEDVYVTHATSVSNVWFRVIGTDYSDEYEILVKNMDEYYNGEGAQDLALIFEEQQYYAAFRFDTWFRVCVIEVDNDNKSVLAWLIDHGDNERFPFDCLYRLAPQFCQLPRQAVWCVLEDLESFNDNEIANEVISNSDSLIGRSLVAKINSKDVDSGFVRATLYDTSGDDDVVVNEKIKDEICAKAAPALPAEGSIMEVSIGDIGKKGEVYIMFDGPAMERIVDVLDSLDPAEISEQKLTNFKHIALNKLYLAKYSKDGNWYRAVVTATPSVQHNKIPVRFVDFGNAECVGISDVADLENLPSILRKLPPQAMKVALHNLPPESLSNPEIARLHSLLQGGEDKIILIKTISLKADPPIVEIFTKEPPTQGKEHQGGGLVSINATVQTERTLYRNNGRNSLLLTTTAAVSSQDDFDLKCPVFTKGQFQPILVVLAAHPGHFIFQAKMFGNDLKTLREQMEAYYDAGAIPPLPPARVTKHKLFAARYSDNMWYRVLVTDTPIGSRVPVRLCDYGDVTFVNISNLRELAPEFRVFPFMAVMGKLAGVVPIHKDWTVEDCIRFQGLVVEKFLAGIIVDIQDKDNKENPMDLVISLRLVDTSQEKDVNISDILVQEKRAVKIT